MKPKTIKCGSRSITVAPSTLGAPYQLAWMKLNDIGTQSSFAMDTACVGKLRAALTDLHKDMLKQDAAELRSRKRKPRRKA